jgi:cyclomaltodextrinase / maltogenic alpha-amylase / neopullulanase
MVKNLKLMEMIKLKFKNISALIAIVAVILSCQKDKIFTAEKIISGNAIIGLGTPVDLQYEKTIIYPTDYFAIFDSVTKIQLPKGLSSLKQPTSSSYLLTGNIEKPIENISFTYNNIVYDIPIKKNNKINFEFTYKPSNSKVKKIQMAGSINGWNPKATNLINDNGVWKVKLVLNAGNYSYQIVEDGKWMLDANNPDKADNGQGSFNSTFFVGNKNSEKPTIYSKKTESNIATISSNLKNIEYLVYWQNHLLDSNFITKSENEISIKIPTNAIEIDRSYIRVFAHNGIECSNDILIPLNKDNVITDPLKLNRDDRHTNIMYFPMIDRFVDGDSSINKKIDDVAIQPEANYYGGDLDGVTEKLKSGYFSDLGINTLWLSPINQNPDKAYGLWNKGGRESKFSGYHGYWPISLSKIDYRFGNDSALKMLIDEAHKKNINVLLDYVAHHIHIEHPLFKQKPDWFTSLYLPDGSKNTEKWDEYRLTTWFDDFMPTFNLADQKVADAMTDSAIYWFKKFPIDGFRHDATKHIPENFWRTLTRKLKDQITIPENRNIYQIGETYGNPELIGSYVNSGQLDAQFDFNLYDSAVEAFAKDSTDFKNLKRTFDESLQYYGSHNLMGNISGNQDRTRFISYADGAVKFSEDPKKAGWSRLIKNENPDGYKKLLMLMAFNITIPGIPVIYYGDEIGMPGANDPDNRRMMVFENLTKNQLNVKNTLSKLTKLRRENMAFMYGETMQLLNDNYTYSFLRNYFGKTAIIIFNKSKQAKTINLNLPESVRKEYLKGNFGNNFNILENGTLQIEMSAQSFEVILN